jgi:hypothetical protein
MQASQQMRRGVGPVAAVAALLAAVLLSGATGYLVRGGLPQSQAPAVATDTAPSWVHQGTGPTDADATSGEQRDEDLYPERFDGGNQAAAPSQSQDLPDREGLVP